MGGERERDERGEKGQGGGERDSKSATCQVVE